MDINKITKDDMLSALMDEHPSIIIDMNFSMDGKRAFQVYSMRYATFSEKIAELERIEFFIAYINRTRYSVFCDTEFNVLEIREVDQAYSHLKTA